MSDVEKNKSSRGKKRRMYQTVEEEVQNDASEPISSAGASSEAFNTQNEEPIREIPEGKIKIEDLEVIKYKGKLLSKAKQEELNTIVRNNIYWSMGFSVLPFPIIDSFLVSTIQLKMLDEISRIYDVPFKENAGKAYLASLIGSTSHQIGTQILKSFIKKIPVIGFASTFVSPVLAASTTYAIAKVFIYHFELGGNLLDFKPEKVRAYFAKQLADGKSKIHHLNKDYNFSDS
jgi:uncharacterized protein (DUF697 family)